MTDFSERIEEEMKVRGTTPLPRWHFLLKRSVFWSLAAASVLIGAVAFAVADYVFFDNEGVSTAMLLESPLEGVIRSIPFVWLFLFALFCVAAFVGLRHTRSGYKYRTVAAVLGVLLVTVALGLLLNVFDFGQAVHYFLLDKTDFYDALIRSSDDFK